jgi:hypothetical protein
MGDDLRCPAVLRGKMSIALISEDAGTFRYFGALVLAI